MTLATLSRARCGECDRVLAVRPPKGGDGSADVFPRHDYPKSDERTGDLCPMSREVVDSSEYLTPEEA